MFHWNLPLLSVPLAHITIVLVYQPNINFLLPSSNIFLTSGEGSKMLMLVHVSPKEEDLCETICSLNFATRARSVDLGTVDSAVSKFNIVYLTLPFKKFNTLTAQV